MFCEVRKKGAGSLTFTFHILSSSLLCLFFPNFCFVLVFFVLFFVVLPPFWEGVVIIRVVAL